MYGCVCLSVCQHFISVTFIFKDGFLIFKSFNFRQIDAYIISNIADDIWKHISKRRNCLIWPISLFVTMFSNLYYNYSFIWRCFPYFCLNSYVSARFQRMCCTLKGKTITKRETHKLSFVCMIISINLSRSRATLSLIKQISGVTGDNMDEICAFIVTPTLILTHVWWHDKDIHMYTSHA